MTVVIIAGAKQEVGQSKSNKAHREEIEDR